MSASMLRENIIVNTAGHVCYGVRLQTLHAQVIENVYVHFLFVGHFKDLFVLLLAI